MHFNIELPTTVADAIIPVTKGCNAPFSVNQIAGGDPGEQLLVVLLIFNNHRHHIAGLEVYGRIITSGTSLSRKASSTPGKSLRLELAPLSP